MHDLTQTSDTCTSDSKNYCEDPEGREGSAVQSHDHACGITVRAQTFTHVAGLCKHHGVAGLKCIAAHRHMQQSSQTMTMFA